MTEMILNTRTLPEPLSRLIRAEKVKVRQAGGEIRLTPIAEISEGTVSEAEQGNLFSRCLILPDTTKKPMLGCMKGKMQIMPDFDEPLEEMKEYMY